MSDKTSKTHIFYNNQFLIAILIIASCWTCFYKLGDPHFYHTRKESRRAEIAREMIETGNYIVPQLEGKVILTKPPLFYWAVAFCSKGQGVNEFTARFPSAAAAAGTVILIFFLGSFLFNRRVGFWSALALMVTNMFVNQARYVEMESMLTFFIVASIYTFFRGYASPSRSKIWFALFFASLGLGTLTKGPFAFTFPLIPIVAYLIIYRDKKFLANRSFLFGLIFFFIVLIPWVFLISKDQPRFILIALWETIGRAVLGYVHREPFYFYFEKTGDTLFPWIFFLPFSIWIALSGKLKSWRKENVFLLYWFIGNLLFLSLSRSKRDFYLTPIAPGVALLIGSTWEALWQWAADKLSYSHTAIQRVFFLIGAALCVISFAIGNPFSLNFPGMNFPYAPSLLLFIGIACVVVAGAKRCFPQLSAAAVSLYTIVGLVLVAQYAYLTYTVPFKNAFESAKTFYVHTSNIVKPNEPLAYLGDNEDYTFSFYARRPVITIKDEKDVIYFCVINKLNSVIKSVIYVF
ncbi:MAG: glycosyltransferase family 39 protein [Proteobacteria bacterium]|nr:glycosyltransferase family 39 protein [Pseudomonadota bacterium]